MVPHLLVVEDDEALRGYLDEMLRGEGYVVTSVGAGQEALRSVEEHQPDLMLLDLSLPDMSGEDVCAEVKSHYPEIPVVFLTAKSSSVDQVRELRLGADDYITKPFTSDELIARLQARLRQRKKGQDPGTISGLKIDGATFQVRRGDRHIQLTPREYALLQCLMLNKGRVLTRDVILDQVWRDDQDVETRIVDVYIGYLRKKIDMGFRKKLIRSVRGFGYTLNDT
ncbi:MAG TPA: response regulator transcription factor [Candidatus Saccharimonadia bacterium]|nr:response regulator transcription factor [Candidatus Saccharimonadia bacterium]